MFISQTNSTNTLLREMLPQPEMFHIWTDYQTAGRGQSGNTWESERGKNLTFSVLLCPDDIPVEALFRLSMLVPLAIVNTLNSPEREALNGHRATVKWPNDIYIGDKKLCGILIENILPSSATDGLSRAYSIAGIGLNVNQKVFIGGAPNPTSLALETGHEWDREVLLGSIIDELSRLRPLLREPEALKAQYMQRLYRREGYHPYVEREVSTTPTMNATPDTEGLFMARIVDIEDDGHLVLETTDGDRRRYHFKQIRYVLQ